MLGAVCVSSTWYIAKQLLVEPRNFRIEQLEKEISSVRELYSANEQVKINEKLKYELDLTRKRTTDKKSQIDSLQKIIEHLKYLSNSHSEAITNPSLVLSESKVNSLAEEIRIKNDRIGRLEQEITKKDQLINSLKKTIEKKQKVSNAADHPSQLESVSTNEESVPASVYLTRSMQDGAGRVQHFPGQELEVLQPVKNGFKVKFSNNEVRSLSYEWISLEDERVFFESSAGDEGFLAIEIRTGGFSGYYTTAGLVYINRSDVDNFGIEISDIKKITSGGGKIEVETKGGKRYEPRTRKFLFIVDGKPLLLNKDKKLELERILRH